MLLKRKMTNDNPNKEPTKSLKEIMDNLAKEHPVDNERIKELQKQLEDETKKTKKLATLLESQRNPEEAKCYLKLAEFGFNHGNMDHDFMLEFYEKAVKADPLMVDAQLGLARIYFYDSRLENAAHRLKIVMNLAPEDSEQYALAEDMLENIRKPKEKKSSEFEDLKRFYQDINEAIRIGLGPQKEGEDNKARFRNAYDMAAARFIGGNVDIEKISSITYDSRAALVIFIEEYQKNPLKVDFNKLKEAIMTAMIPVFEYAKKLPEFQPSKQELEELRETYLANEVLKKIYEDARRELP